MSRYTYTLNPGRREQVHKQTYRKKQLEKMTTFQLREICRKERLVIPKGQSQDRECLIRLIMRFRGQKEYRHIRTDCEGGMDRLQEFFQNHPIHLLDRQEIRIPGTVVLYRDTEMNEQDNYQIQSESPLCRGNLFLVDEDFQVYTCFYIESTLGNSKPLKTLHFQSTPFFLHPHFSVGFIIFLYFYQEIFK